MNLIGWNNQTVIAVIFYKVAEWLIVYFYYYAVINNTVLQEENNLYCSLLLQYSHATRFNSARTSDEIYKYLVDILKTGWSVEYIYIHDYYTSYAAS